jgi:hypothetical protein
VRATKGADVYVRLATAWADRGGIRHAPGDLVDIDPVTLAELEEQGVVDIEGASEQVTSAAPSAVEEKAAAPKWLGPGDEELSSDDTDAPDADGAEEQ